MRTTPTSTTLSPDRTTALLVQALMALFIGLALFFAAGASYVIGVQFWYAGRIFPGVSVGGVELGGLSQQEAAVKIFQSITYPQTGKILFEYEQSGLVSPGQMGLFLDANTSAQRAFEVGRSGGLARALGEQFNVWYYGRDLPPVMIFDQRMAFEYLSARAREIDKPTVEADISIKGTEVVVTNGQTGRSLDIPATLVLLHAQLQTQRDGVVPLVVRDHPPVVVDVSAQAKLARDILSAPLKLTMPAGQPDDDLGPWSFDAQTLAAMLAFERVESNGGAEYQVTVDSQLLRNYLLDLAPRLSKSPKNARFIFNDETRQLEVIEASITGRELNVEGSIQTIQEQLLKGKHKVALEFNYRDPPVSDRMSGEQLGITELVHAESTYFYGSSAERVQNIKAAAARFHGLLIAPGETFSMGAAMGDISLDNGYAEALIIVGDRTIKGVGGGVCQVSTTLYRAAFFAGFPILERHAHAYRVYYYEKVAGNRINPNFAGMDATVYFPLVDFKFTNDTDHWLLMETYVIPSASSITWKFYSTKDGREVAWQTTGPINVVEPPKPKYKENPDLKKDEIKQVDWEAQGADVTVTRTVKRDGNVLFQDRFYTHYQPWQAIYEYGPGTDIPDQNNNNDDED